jgi:hypothetical protein
VIHWPSYNHSLVKRGEILFAYDYLEMWDDNLDRMNENKKGKKYKLPDSFILVIIYITEYIFTYILDKHRRNHKSDPRKESSP